MVCFRLLLVVSFFGLAFRSDGLFGWVWVVVFENSIVCQCLFWPAPGFSSLIVGVGLFGNFLLGVRLFWALMSHNFFVESLILAQDERWRRA